MWVFDGEEWTQEGEEEKRKSETAPSRLPTEEEMLLPQLQVIEIVQVTRKTRP